MLVCFVLGNNNLRVNKKGSRFVPKTKDLPRQHVQERGEDLGHPQHDHKQPTGKVSHRRRPAMHVPESCPQKMESMKFTVVSIPLTPIRKPMAKAYIGELGSWGVGEFEGIRVYVCAC